LDSSLENIMDELDVPKPLQLQILKRGIQTIRAFKHMDLRDFFEKLDEDKIHETTPIEKAQLQIFQQECEKSKDKNLANFSRQISALVNIDNISNLGNCTKIDTKIETLLCKVASQVRILMFKEGISTLLELKHIDIDEVKKIVKRHLKKEKELQSSTSTSLENDNNNKNDKENKKGKGEEKGDGKGEKKREGKEEEKGKGEAKDDGKEQDKKEDEEEEVLQINDLVLLKEVFKIVSDAEDGSKFLDLNDPITKYFPTHLKNISASLQQLITGNLKITTLQEFITVGTDGIISALEKPKFKLTLTDKSALARVDSVIKERVIEKEIYE